MWSRAGIGSFLGLSVIALPHSALAGAWTLPEGEGQAALVGTWSNATRAFDAGGNRQSTPETNKLELQGLLEYGVTDRFTAMVLPGLQHIDIAPPIDAQRSGLGYFEFGGRYRLFDGPSWVVSAQATLRVPGVLEPVNPAAIGYTDPEVDLRALFGKSGSIGAWPVFADFQLAQRFRVGGPPDELRADLTFGARPLPRWLLLAQSFNVFAEGSSPPLFPNYSYHKLQLSVVYDLTPVWSLQAGGFATVGGHNALQENGMLLGTWYKF
jgi:hypothetical protein